jgi:hypothetical protein
LQLHIESLADLPEQGGRRFRHAQYTFGTPRPINLCNLYTELIEISYGLAMRVALVSQFSSSESSASRPKSHAMLKVSRPAADRFGNALFSSDAGR